MLLIQVYARVQASILIQTIQCMQMFYFKNRDHVDWEAFSI